MRDYVGSDLGIIYPKYNEHIHVRYTENKSELSWERPSIPLLKNSTETNPLTPS